MTVSFVVHSCALVIVLRVELSVLGAVLGEGSFGDHGTLPAHTITGIIGISVAIVVVRGIRLVLRCQLADAGRTDALLEGALNVTEVLNTKVIGSGLPAAAS